MVKIIGKYPTSINERPSGSLFWHQIWIDLTVIFLLASAGIALCLVSWNDRKAHHSARTVDEPQQDLLILNNTVYELKNSPNLLILHGALYGSGVDPNISDSMLSAFSGNTPELNGTTYIETAFAKNVRKITISIRPKNTTTVLITHSYEAYELYNKMNGVAFVFGLAVPILVVLLCQFGINSFWDGHNAILGIFFSVMGTFVFAKVVQVSIAAVKAGFWHQRKFWPMDANIDRYEEKYSLSSNTFPSTFSAVNCAGLVFLFLYLNAKLKVWANYRPSMWKLAVLYVPILGAFLLLLSEIAMISDAERHIHLIDWYDSLVGALIGAVFALSAYRMTYTSIFDFQTNHIPLSPRPPLISEARQEYENAYHCATLANRGGWGSHSNPNFPPARTPPLKVIPHCAHPHCEELHDQSRVRLWKYRGPDRMIKNAGACETCAQRNK